jgi:hypothetical protein
MTATGLGFPARPPSLGRLAHIRAVLAARLWLQASPVWAAGQPWWHSERRLRADQPAAGRREHVPDAEIHWPSIEASPYAGQVWAIEVELTPKAAARTTRIMTGLLSPVRYAQVIYLTAPAARSVVTRPRGSLPAGEQPRVVIRELPAAAFTPEPQPMSMWSWLKLTIFLWLLRKTIKALRVAAARRGGGRGVAGHDRGGRRVRGGVAAGLAPGPAGPDRRRGR